MLLFSILLVFLWSPILWLNVIYLFSKFSSSYFINSDQMLSITGTLLFLSLLILLFSSAVIFAVCTHTSGACSLISNCSKCEVHMNAQARTADIKYYSNQYSSGRTKSSCHSNMIVMVYMYTVYCFLL